MKWFGWRDVVIVSLICVSVLQQLEIVTNALQPVEREGIYVLGAMLKELKQQEKEPGELDWQRLSDVLRPAEIHCTQWIGTPENKQLITIRCSQEPVIGWLALGRPSVFVRILDKKTTLIDYGHRK